MSLTVTMTIHMEESAGFPWSFAVTFSLYSARTSRSREDNREITAVLELIVNLFSSFPPVISYCNLAFSPLSLSDAETCVVTTAPTPEFSATLARYSAARNLGLLSFLSKTLTSTLALLVRGTEPLRSTANTFKMISGPRGLSRSTRSAVVTKPVVFSTWNLPSLLSDVMKYSIWAFWLFCGYSALTVTTDFPTGLFSNTEVL